MKIELSLRCYNRLLGEARLASREYMLLAGAKLLQPRGLDKRTPLAMEIRCLREDAVLLLELARWLGRDVEIEVENAISSARED